MKRLFWILGLLFTTVISSVAQNDFIQFLNGKQQRVTVSEVGESGINIVGTRGEDIFISEIELAFVELEKRGMYYFNYDTDAKDINSAFLKKRSLENPRSLLRKGSKVYIPISSDYSKDVLGRYNVREELTTNYPNLWRQVYTEYEAEFILEYYFEGNSGYFLLKTRDGKTFYRSVNIQSEGEFIPTQESRNIVDKLLKKEVPKINAINQKF